MFRSILFLVLVGHVTAQHRSDVSRSSTIRTTADHALLGHVINTQRTYDFMSCAYKCLARDDCASFNYENVENGKCEMSKRGLENAGDSSALSWRDGYVFGQLMNISVSRDI